MKNLLYCPKCGVMKEAVTDDDKCDCGQKMKVVGTVESAK